MKPSRQRKGKIVEASKHHKDLAGYAGVRKSNYRTGSVLQKATEDPGVLAFSLDHVSVQQLPKGGNYFRETKDEAHALGNKTGQLHSSVKIKLQLFPIDESTRIGLEKDGHNPFLELTLRTRKKISSVLKHLNTKWGSSSVAKGEVMLFPFNTRMESLATERRWTSNDRIIRAGDVCIAVGSPEIFRLRYGWFFHLQQKTLGAPYASIFPEASSEFEGIQEGFYTVSNCTNDQIGYKKVASEGFREPNNVKRAADAGVGEQDDEVKINDGPAQSTMPWDDSLTNLSIGGLLSEVSMQGKFSTCDMHPESKPVLQPIQLISDISVGALLSEVSQQGKINNCDLAANGSTLLCPTTEKGFSESQCPWDDTLTTLSIGGLLSEASLLGKIANCDTTANGTKSGVQPNLSISDSFDAFIAAQINSHPQLAKPLSHDSHLSFLDAEETCHAFCSRKFSSVKDAMAASTRASIGDSTEDMCSKSGRFPNLAEATQAGLAKDPSRQEHKSNLLPFSGLYNEDSSSLGLLG